MINKVYIYINVALEKITPEIIDICSVVAKNAVSEVFGDEFVFEAERLDDEGAMNLQFGLDHSIGLSGADESLLELSGDISRQISEFDGLGSEDERFVRVGCIDFSENIYQSYQDGDHDTGQISSDDDYDEYIDDMRKIILKRKNSTIRDWMKR